MKVRYLAACLLVTFQVQAKVDWDGMRATLVDTQQLSEMRGKYRVSRSGEDLYFGVRMLTHWSDSNGSGSAGMDVVIEGNQVSVRAHDGSEVGGEVDSKGIHQNGSGMVQLVQIAGNGNSASNQSELKVVDTRQLDGSAAGGGSQVQYYQVSGQDNRVGYKVTIGESIAIQEIRSLKSAHGAYQGIKILDNDLVVQNKMLMEVKLPKSWAENKQLRVSHSLLRGL
ncbi:hypothetical protein [Vibrio sinaloensis]|uniref:hypothetical protein n=1 Tax=Photobacterium sp. (strain ATCC 43367) TaxID=379097 RepID=UPI00205ADB00|nr:hypothetical protein [Vibrio sinaloensis]UPQ90189.1 hypothetical protein MTO69_15655 [Vibrio sinaloensis]